MVSQTLSGFAQFDNPLAPSVAKDAAPDIRVSWLGWRLSVTFLLFHDNVKGIAMKRELFTLTLVALIGQGASAQLIVPDRNFPPDNSSYTSSKSSDGGVITFAIDINALTRSTIDPGFHGTVFGVTPIEQSLVDPVGGVTVDNGIGDLSLQLDYVDTVGDTDTYDLTVLEFSGKLASGTTTQLYHHAQGTLVYKTGTKGDYHLSSHFTMEIQRSMDGGQTWTPDDSPWDFDLKASPVPEPSAFLGLGFAVFPVLLRRGIKR